MSCQRPPTSRTKVGERGWLCWEYAFIIFIIGCMGTLIFAVVWIWTHQPPSIYEGETSLPLIRYLNSDNHITMENLTGHFSEYRESILEELDRLNDDMYVDRIFKGGVWYYRLNGWGVLYLNYLEARE